MTPKMTPMTPAQVHLLPGLFRQRFDLNLRYLMSLRRENLLQNHYLEARLWSVRLRNTHDGEPGRGDDLHWGWESPTCELRGHFLGHWLSAMARVYATTGDTHVKARADEVVSELARCQESNGGEWVGSIPESYLHWTAKGRPTWAPQYVVHKTLMGLYDAYAFVGSEEALDVLQKCARWFHRWTGAFSREEMDEIFEAETGGMLEVWADLYGVTGSQEHLDLISRYERPRLFDRLLAGEDPLTNRHANSTIPEVHGAARAYEATGEDRWREIVEAYWQCAVTDRGFFCTGGQTLGEIWTPPLEFAARLGDSNQEHCSVYNMIRLADYLLRWTGEARYADYIERNLYNGILAQQNPHTGMVAYFLPLHGGGRKIWGSPTYDFWCCHGTLVQAHTMHGSHVYFADDDGLAIAQYLPTELHWSRDGVPVTIRQAFDTEACSSNPLDPDSARHRPKQWTVDITVRCHEPVPFALKLRLPEWAGGKVTIAVNGEPAPSSPDPSGFCVIRRTWGEDVVRLVLPKTLKTCPLPDQPDTVAFLDGPIVLAGLCDEERTLEGSADDPASILVPDNERGGETWLSGYRTVGQARGLRFKALHEIVDEPYTVYFPVKP